MTVDRLVSTLSYEWRSTGRKLTPWPGEATLPGLSSGREESKSGEGT